MSDTKWTPGPWEYEESCGEVYRDEPLESVAMVLQASGPWEANARLIAAAPEMYEALARAEDSLLFAVENIARHIPPEELAIMEERLEAIRAALAKARGEA